MLLVHDGQVQSVKRGAALDDRLRADHHVHAAALHVAPDAPLVSGWNAAGDQFHSHAQGRQQIAQRGGVLFGQHFGGRHDGSLPAVANDRVQRAGRHHGLAGTDVSLQQPAHGPVAPQVVQDLGHGHALAVRQLEGQLAPKRRQCVPVDAYGTSWLAFAPGLAAAQDCNLVDQQLRECEATRGNLGGGGVRRKVEMADCRRDIRQVVCPPLLGVQRLGYGDGEVLDRQRHPAAQLPLRKPARERIHGDQTPGVHHAVHVQLVLRAGQLAVVGARLHPSGEGHVVPTAQGLGQIHLVEPDRQNLPGLVRDGRLDHAYPAGPCRSHPDLNHVADHRDLASRLRLPDRHDRGVIDIAPRPVVQQIANRLNTQRRQPLLARRPDTRKHRDRHVRVRAGGGRPGRAQLREHGPCQVLARSRPQPRVLRQATKRTQPPVLGRDPAR